MALDTMSRHSPLSQDTQLQLRQEELTMEAVDGGDVGEDACGYLWRDARRCQLGAEHLDMEGTTGMSVLTMSPLSAYGLRRCGDDHFLSM